ncbi:MAG: transketolase [Ignavibacteria bacterium]
MNNSTEIPIEELSINTIRTLSMDAIQKANSGHPGTPMALAPLAYVLWKRIMKYNPKDPKWFNRDRFILSNGHASMLLYSALYLTGYDITLDDIKNFRQLHSKTPGHPEYGMTPGVETTTGPLGQGIMNSVGFAIAEAHLATMYNRDNYNIVDHYTYAFCGDGDFMEGASHEAASLAGHLGLGKLIWVYDDNHISIEGPTELAYNDDVSKRFESYHWHVQNIGDNANDIDALTKAFENAQSVKDKPSLIIVRSHIAYGAPNAHDTSEAHGSPLGEDEVKLAKRFYHWPENEKFLVPDNVLKHMHEAVDYGNIIQTKWNIQFEEYRKKYPELAGQLENSLNHIYPDGWESGIAGFDPSSGAIATRDASAKIINSIAEKIPAFIGGSGDLSPSTKTLIKSSGYFEKDNYANKNIAWGIRELCMCAASSGIALHGGLRPFASTFFVFTDYARPAIRLASLMKLPVIYVMTHDSIGLGEDGPTHQPIEHLASLRAMPNLSVIRPADANETGLAWATAMKRTGGPTVLVLTRQKVPSYMGTARASSLSKGAYILSKEEGKTPDIILIASGSEVQLILEAQKKLKEEKIFARVVSMPSWDLFEKQTQSYRDDVLPPGITKRLAVEAASEFGWEKWTGNEGDIIGMESFGASAPDKELFREFGFTVENVISRAKKLLGK